MTVTKIMFRKGRENFLLPAVSSYKKESMSDPINKATKDIMNMVMVISLSANWYCRSINETACRKSAEF